MPSFRRFWRWSQKTRTVLSAFISAKHSSRFRWRLNSPGSRAQRKRRHGYRMISFTICSYFKVFQHIAGSYGVLTSIGTTLVAKPLPPSSLSGQGSPKFLAACPACHPACLAAVLSPKFVPSWFPFELLLFAAVFRACFPSWFCLWAGLVSAVFLSAKHFYHVESKQTGSLWHCMFSVCRCCAIERLFCVFGFPWMLKSQDYAIIKFIGPYPMILIVTSILVRGLGFGGRNRQDFFLRAVFLVFSFYQ